MAISGADIATYALKWKGVPYVWGGFQPKPGWDCSGAVGYWLGHGFGMVLPGGYRWTGRGHGPVAAQYKIWTKATTVTQAEAGDLCCWLTHIGIAISGTQMISAVDTQLGTAITNIAGPRGEPLSVRRINTLAAVSGAPTRAAAGCTPALIAMPYLVTKGVMMRARKDAPADRGD